MGLTLSGYKVLKSHDTSTLLFDIEHSKLTYCAAFVANIALYTKSIVLPFLQTNFIPGWVMQLLVPIILSECPNMFVSCSYIPYISYNEQYVLLTKLRTSYYVLYVGKKFLDD